ncbi:MAG: hypothetical protein U9Q99_01660 [Nanoarchaeota archaeon]|nr:hypothetical protein [Nanoarchaeota archaeon]
MDPYYYYIDFHGYHKLGVPGLKAGGGAYKDGSRTTARYYDNGTLGPQIRMDGKPGGIDGFGKDMYGTFTYISHSPYGKAGTYGQVSAEIEEGCGVDYGKGGDGGHCVEGLNGECYGAGGKGGDGGHPKTKMTGYGGEKGEDGAIIIHYVCSPPISYEIPKVSKISKEERVFVNEWDNFLKSNFSAVKI